MNNTSDNYTSPINQSKYYQDYLIREKNISEKNINLRTTYNSMRKRKKMKEQCQGRIK